MGKPNKSRTKGSLKKSVSPLSESVKKKKLFEKMEDEIGIIADTLKKLMENEKEFLIRVDTIRAKHKYTLTDGREFISRDNYWDLYDIIIENHKKIVKILEGLEKLK